MESRLKFPITTKNLIAHIRRASVGGMAYENCHPFVARDTGGRVWKLAHNGTLFEAHGTERYQA
ncbi:MAG: class II glutamine amidotransferase, partial [Oscillospiraceae bacterium]|nr:class II glutamine amidotransferase [Oscillospiraceae bacterium]